MRNPSIDPVARAHPSVETLIPWLRFLRWRNLLLIALTMALVRYAVIQPHLALPGVFVVSALSFSGMVLSTLLIAAAGYVANDLVDRKIDEINRPGRVYVGRLVSERAANQLAMGLFIAAAIALIPMVWTAGFESWQMIFPAAGGSLLAYAYGLKCRPLIGNVLIALLSALIPLLVFFAERPGLHVDSLESVQTLIWGYAGFAFLASLFREVIKDLEDVDGDEVFGCSTLAVVNPRLAGVLARGTIALLSAALIAFLAVVDASLWALGAAAILVAVPVGMAAWALRRPAGPSDAKGVYARVSALAKLTMLGGLILLPILART